MQTSTVDATTENKAPIRLSQKEIELQQKKAAKAAFKEKQTDVQTETPKKDKKKKLKDENLDTIKDTIEDTKGAKIKSKYNYPEDVLTEDQRKTFRRKSRATRDSLLAQITELGTPESKEDKSKLKALLKEQADFNALTYAATPE